MNAKIRIRTTSNQGSFEIESVPFSSLEIALNVIRYIEKVHPQNAECYATENSVLLVHPDGSKSFYSAFQA
jgi:hypothetical protein